MKNKIKIPILMPLFLASKWWIVNICRLLKLRICKMDVYISVIEAKLRGLLSCVFRNYKVVYSSKTMVLCDIMLVVLVSWACNGVTTCTSRSPDTWAARPIGNVIQSSKTGCNLFVLHGPFNEATSGSVALPNIGTVRQ